MKKVAMLKGQIAIELLVILAVLSLALIPVLFAMQWNADNSPDRLAISKATFSVSRLSSAVNSVGSMGEGARLRTQIEMPDTLNLSADGKEIVAEIETTYGEVVILQPVDYIVQGVGLARVSTQGTYTFDIYATDSKKVRIEFAK